MSHGGYRTLCVAERTLTPQQYAAWNEDFHEASVALEDRDAKIAAVSEAIEQDLVLLGATAVEDKLQVGGRGGGPAGGCLG
jgi:magnesium-transporting ATPase (P-type)